VVAIMESPICTCLCIDDSVLLGPLLNVPFVRGKEKLDDCLERRLSWPTEERVLNVPRRFVSAGSLMKGFLFHIWSFPDSWTCSSFCLPLPLPLGSVTFPKYVTVIGSLLQRSVSND
jgi:hypothetical protein